MKPLNPWLPTVLRKAQRLVEDSDRKTLAAGLLQVTIRRVNALATLSAHKTPEPKVERFQSDEGVSLGIEWSDPESGWFLCVSVKRKLGEKPRVALEFSGNPKSYSTEKPADDDIRQALHDYFQEWKR
jgi:hypothetical protein